jgi:predicted metal-dependent phosphoesterase TrpH
MDDSRSFQLDLHVHSDTSYDGHEPVSLVLEHVAEIGLDGVVITDHDRIEGSLRAARLAPEYGLVGIPGVEVSTSDGHLLAIGVEETPAKGLPLQSTIDTVHNMGGVAVVPHPFQRTRHGVRKRVLHTADPDAIEAYNSMLFTGYQNRRASRYAKSFGYPTVGGSDAHYLPNVGRAYTQIDVPGNEFPEHNADVDADALVDAIRTGTTAVQGKRTPIHRSVRQYAIGAAKKGTFEVTRRAPYLPTVPASMLDR